MSGYARGVTADRGEALVLPAAAERPRLEVHVRQAPLLHRLLRPVGRFLDVGRAGEPRAVDVGEVALDLHHLRALQPFVLDAVDRVEVELFGRPATAAASGRPIEDGDERRSERTCVGIAWNDKPPTQTVATVSIPVNVRERASRRASDAAFAAALVVRRSSNRYTHLDCAHDFFC